MKPTSDALQVFYGTIPLILVLGAIFFREQLLLKDTRLRSVEAKLMELTTRIVALESRAGIVFRG